MFFRPSNLDTSPSGPTTKKVSLRMFLFECLPFDLTFSILFEHGGFDNLEMVLGRNACFEFLKLMNNSRRAELLCICRTVQLLAHPAHALFLLNYPPDSSIPENRSAWDIASKCCIVWEPDVRSVVLAMRVFLPSAQQQVFPWLNTSFLEDPRSETEWKQVGVQMGVCYKFDRYWWYSQREAFHLEKVAVESNMRIMIFSTAASEKARLLNRIKRGELEEIVRAKEKNLWRKTTLDEQDRKLREYNAGMKRKKGVGESNDEKLKRSAVSSGDGKAVAGNAKLKEKVEEEEQQQPKRPAISSEDRKKAAENAKLKEKTLHSILRTVERACGISNNLSEARLEKIATLIVSIETENPFIKWNLRNILHAAASKFGTITAWDLEFLLSSLKWEVVEGAVEKLKMMK
jgi:hypothetical protein